MTRMEKTIDVNVPVHVAYNQWTQFKEFPQFMEGVYEVQQLDDKRLFWRAKIAVKEETWNAEITDQTPDKRIAWKSTSGKENAGAVLFEPIDTNATRVTLRMDYEPEGIIENIGDWMGFVSRRVEGDLNRFKLFIESRGEETGAWRGEIHGDRVKQDSEAIRAFAVGDPNPESEVF